MPAENAYDCTTLNDQFSRETGRIGQRIYRKGQYTNFWLSGIKQEEWPNHMGNTIRQVISQRTQPTTIEDWTAVGSSNGNDVNACIPPVEKIGYAADEFTHNLSFVAVESEDICLEDIRTSAFPAEEVNNYYDNFADYINIKWQKRYQDEYIRVAQHKVIVEPGFTEASNAFPSVAPTSQLTLGVLKRFWSRLTRDNAGTDGMAFDGSNAPVYPVIVGYETAENIRHLNSEVRNDFRWSKRVGELLGTMADPYSYGGFAFIIDPFPPRYNDNGSGGFVRVPEYVASAATKGTKQIVNPAYENAKYEASIPFHDKVFCGLNPSPNVSVGSNVQYNAQNYRGDIRWVNKYDRVCNPDKNIGHWRAKLASASKVIHPEWGYVMLHLRCNPAAGLLACPEGSGYIS